MNLAQPGDQTMFCSSAPSCSEFLPMGQQSVLWLHGFGWCVWNRDNPTGLDTLHCTPLSPNTEGNHLLTFLTIVRVGPSLLPCPTGTGRTPFALLTHLSTWNLN